MESAGPGLVAGRGLVRHAGHEPVQQTVARASTPTRRLDLVMRFLAAVTEVRQSLAAAQAWLPLTGPADWQEFVDALDAVRLRVEAEAATARLGALADVLTRTAGAPTRRRS